MCHFVAHFHDIQPFVTGNEFQVLLVVGTDVFSPRFLGDEVHFVDGEEEDEDKGAGTLDPSKYSNLVHHPVSNLEFLEMVHSGGIVNVEQVHYHAHNGRKVLQCSEPGWGDLNGGVG